MTIKALIIDDEPLAHKVILQYATNIPFLEVTGQCYKASEAYPLLENGEVDLIFLDINLPRLKGLDFLRTLEHPPVVVVTSAYEEFALEGYELRVADYLLKPFSFERFLRAMGAVRANLSTTPSNTTGPTLPPTSSDGQADYLFIKVDKRHLRIPFADIAYLESYGNYVKIWDGSNFNLTPRTLTSFVEELPANFVRIHKSYLINKDHIDYVEGAMMVMKNGQMLPVGKNFRKVVREWLG
ncbi:LytR/AlgR family response regulator transcription factor [Neolewinella persica]|uniref:LytR/AlgR family response regulator transcription factor n=1 Tax=Neolewinella persica TaxID=70998 RepID=UPI00037BC600|nr:LytTR family DNA-binding domain-containing protein [Neolewinella persica]